jgi:hypothetical protein
MQPKSDEHEPISRFAGFCVPRGEFFGQLVYVHGVLVRLFAEFVRGHVICFTVCDSSRGVSVGRKVVKLCNSIVRTLWHGVLLNRLNDGRVLSGLDSVLRNVPSWRSDILQARRLRALRA